MNRISVQLRLFALILPTALLGACGGNGGTGGSAPPHQPLLRSQPTRSCPLHWPMLPIALRSRLPTEAAR
jgi:hypothetical protein